MKTKKRPKLWCWRENSNLRPTDYESVSNARDRHFTLWAGWALSARFARICTGIALLFSGSAFAGDWTGYDTAREAGFMTLLAADCLQTRYGIEHPGQFREVNRLVAGGKDEPSKGRLDNICLGTALGHYAISRWLSPDSRKFWQYVTIFAEIDTVANNKRSGVKIKIEF